MLYTLITIHLAEQSLDFTCKELLTRRGSLMAILDKTYNYRLLVEFAPCFLSEPPQLSEKKAKKTWTLQEGTHGNEGSSTTLQLRFEREFQMYRLHI